MLYEFECLACHEKYDVLTSYDKTGKYRSVKCPKCKSKKKTKLVSDFSFGKTASKMDNFGYRAGFNMEKAQNERRAAETISHMGNTDEFYKPIDDLNGPTDYFGEVK